MSHRHCTSCWMELEITSGPVCEVCRIKEDITKTLNRIQSPPEEDENENVPSVLRRLWSSFGSR